MKTQSGSSSRRTVGILAAVCLVGAIAIAFGLKQILNRPVENSLRYVPDDAAVVISFDITPHASQIVAFKSISDGLKRHGYNKSLQDGILQVLGSNTVYKDLRPLIKGGIVAYLDGTNIKDPSSMGGFLALSVTDPTQATQALKNHGPVKFYKGLTYVADHSVCLTVIDDQLLIGNSEKELYKAKQVKDGELHSIAASATFQEARDGIDSDSNLIVFASPMKFESMAKGQLANAPEWVSCGISVRDAGMEFSMATKNDLAKNPEEKGLSDAPPLRSDLFDILPSGSYGLCAMSSLSQAMRAGLSAVRKQPDVGKMIDDGEKEFNKKTGLSVESDFAKATAGDAILAFYPTDAAQTKGIDMVVVADDQNGADPADEFKKYEAYVEKQMPKDANSPLFVKKPANGLEEYVLSPKLIDDAVHGLGESAAKAYKDKNSPFANKTVAVAIVGKAVICSSSQALLDRTVASYQSKKDNLSADPNYAPYLSSLSGNQSLMVVSLSRVAASLKSALAGSNSVPPGIKGLLDVIERLKQPMTIKGKVSPSGLTTGTAFIPLDYAALMDAIANAAHPQPVVPAA